MTGTSEGFEGDGGRYAPTVLLHGGALGDFVLAYHLALRLVDRPTVQLAAVARHPVVTWFAKRGLLADGRRDDALGMHELYTNTADGEAPAVRFIRQFDVVLNLLGDVESQVHRNLKSCCDARVLSIKTASDDSSGIHIVAQWRQRLAEACGVCLGAATAPPPLPVEYRKGCRAQLHHRFDAAGNQPILVLHPGSGGRRKCAPLEFIEAVESLARESNWRTVWMVGPDELGRDGAGLVNRLRTSAPVVCEPDIAEAADLLCGADAYVGNDSGMSHLAALLALQTVVVYVTTSPAVWCPLGLTVRMDLYEEGLSGSRVLAHLCDRWTERSASKGGHY